MRKLFLILLNFGTDDSQAGHDKRRIKTTNLISLVVAFFILIGYINYFVFKANIALGPVTGFFFLALTSLYLNKIKRSNASFILFTLNLNVSIFFLNQYYPPEAGAYLYYFPLIVSVVLLNNPSFSDKFSLTHFTISVVFFIANLMIDFPDFQLNNLTPLQVRLLWHTDFIMATSITAVLSFLLTRLIFNQNQEIIGQNDDLKKTKEIVKISLKEKEVLLAELHHRVKNNLAIISGLLNMQEDATSNNEAKQIIGDSKTRIMSMALVHKMLYENKELKSIDAGKYSSELIYELFNSYNLINSVTITESYDTIMLPVSKSIPLGLILNEIVTNSIKYAFKPDLKRKGTFSIAIIARQNCAVMIVKDDGKGFLKDFNVESEALSLGIYLIKTLSEQIDGKVHFSNDGGAKIEVEFMLN